jgi:LacI family transcriptional regulator
MSDVAKLAGVSIMTVSRVLNGTVKVSDDAHARVVKAVAKLNYLPNEVARSLRISSTHQIGVIVPNLHDPFFAVCANAVSVIAKEHGYSTVITTSDEDPVVEHREAQRMLRRHVDGLVLIPTSGRSRLHARDFADMPIVTLDRPVHGGAFDCVTVQNKSGAEMAVRHLIGHRHRRIVCVGLSQKLWTIKQRMEGYCAAMAFAGLKPDLCTLGESPEEMLQALQSLLARSRPPTALFCTNNLITRNALHSLSALNVGIPQEMAMVGFDDFDMADIIKPAVTVVRQPVGALGRTAAELLFQRLASGSSHKDPRRIIMPLELVVRDSCGGRARLHRSRGYDALDLAVA